MTLTISQLIISVVIIFIIGYIVADNKYNGMPHEILDDEPIITGPPGKYKKRGMAEDVIPKDKRRQYSYWKETKNSTPWNFFRHYKCCPRCKEYIDPNYWPSHKKTCK